VPTILEALLSSLIRSLITSICILAIWLSLVLRWLSHLLRAIMELIANSKIVFSNIDDLLKSIIMTMYLDRVSYNRLDTIVMTHYLHRSNNTKLRHIMTTRRLSIHLIVVARYDQRCDGIACPDLNRTIMSSENNTITGFHDGHRYAVIRYVNRVFIRWSVRGTDSLSHEVFLTHKLLLIHTSITLLELNVGAWHTWLIEGLTKMLLEIYNK